MRHSENRRRFTMGTKKSEIGNPGNGGKAAIDLCKPYTVTATINGNADLLMHRWDCDSVKEKSVAAKGSAAKKTDNLESYVYRDEDGFICVPGEYIRQSILGAAKFKQDPRSPRKCAVDIVKAGVFSLTDLCSLGVKDWDYEDRRRVQVMRAGITRTRPAMKAGWRAEVSLIVNLPEYLSLNFVHELLNDAGRLIGIGDFRPTFGRFLVSAFN